MDRYSLMHRWANKDFGRKNTLTANNVRCEGRNYFSYNTVFGQWLDLRNNVVLIYEGGTSKSSSKHQFSRGFFGSDVHVFPYDDGARDSYYYNGCNLVSRWGFDDEEFTEQHRMKLLAYFVFRMYEEFEYIVTTKKKGAENVSFRMWGYFEELCGIYKDCSAKKFLAKHSTFRYDMDEKKMRKLVTLLAEGERDVETITDAMFGKGEFRKYMEYASRFRKAEKNRAQTEALCKRLGIKSPYETYGRGISTNLTAKQIRKLTATERLELHWKALAYEEYWKNHDAIEDKRLRSEMNAYKWIVGYEQKKSSWGRGYDKCVRKCRNMFTCEEYNLKDNTILGFWWCKTNVSFDYDSFRKAEDKKAWIENFYAEVAEARNNRFAISILRDMHHGTFEGDKLIGYYQTIYKAGLDEEELNVCMEFIRKCKAHYADEEARERARRIEAERQAAEEAREKAYREQVKQEQIVAYRERGIEGERDLWRTHLLEIYNCFTYEKDFYNGGNVLLRLSLDKTRVETSKNIRIPLAIARKFYRIVKGWHENPATFKPIEIDTKGSGKYTISSYENDVLTAGCHDISWAEIEHLWAEVEKITA